MCPVVWLLALKTNTQNFPTKFTERLKIDEARYYSATFTPKNKLTVLFQRTIQIHNHHDY